MPQTLDYRTPPAAVPGRPPITQPPLGEVASVFVIVGFFLVAFGLLAGIFAVAIIITNAITAHT